MVTKKKSPSRKKGSSRKRSTREVRKKQELPGGWWQQIMAFVLVALAIVCVATWAGGSDSQIHKITFSVIGNAVYVLPFLFTYLAVKIFRSEDNRIPTVVWFVALFFVAFIAGACGVSTYGEAAAQARSVLTEAYGFTDAQHAAYSRMYEAFDVTDPENAVWKFVFVNPDDYSAEMFRVILDGDTGEVLQHQAYERRRMGESEEYDRLLY